jgi:hypothetical protein
MNWDLNFKSFCSPPDLSCTKLIQDQCTINVELQTKTTMNIVLTEYCSPLGSKSRNRIGPHAIICFCFYLHPRIQTKNTEASIFSLRYILADIISFVLNNGLLPSFTSTKTPFSNLIVSFSPCTRSAGTSSTSPRSGSGRSTPARSSSSAPWSRSTCSLTYSASCLVPC